MSERAAFLDTIRRRVARGDDAGRRAAVAARLGHPRAGVEMAARGRAARLDLFVAKAQAAAAGVEVIERTRLAAAVGDVLRRHNLPQRLRLGADPRLAAIDWGGGGPERLTGPSDGTDLVALSHAVAGVAATGTLVLASGPDNPTTLNFLPETHIVVLEESDLADEMEGVWAQLRAQAPQSGPALPRTVNFVTGPSRSADIEQTLILGAHGPVRLHILVVRDKDGDTADDAAQPRPA